MKAVLISCNDQYVAKAIVALKGYLKYNPDFIPVVLGTKFKESSAALLKAYDIQVIEVDLRDIVPNFGHYPLECFYHLYAYKVLDVDYIVNIEPDFYTNKPLKLDFSTVKYVAGSYHAERFIESFPAIARHLSVIKKRFDIQTASSDCRILGGLKVYNVRALLDIDFFENILDLHRKSILYNIPRLGDDSLMVLYQMIYPDHVQLLDPLLHVIFHNNLQTVNQITHFHFVGKRKYWSGNTPRSEVDRYFVHKALQFLYNTFPQEYIKTHFPQVYVPQGVIPFWYWQGKPNFGDLLTPYFLKRFCHEQEYRISKEKRIPQVLGCGSIMSAAHPQTILYGCGIRDQYQKVEGGIVQFVRGPLTRKRLLDLGYSCPPSYGDLGMLLPHYYQGSKTKLETKKRYLLGILPHYIHYVQAKEYFQEDIQSGTVTVIRLMHPDIEVTIDHMLQCDYLVSSSLHGLIVADAYNIPNKWIYFDDRITGDNTKYYDYFQAVERKDQTFILYSDIDDIPTFVSTIHPVSVSGWEKVLAELKEQVFFDEKGMRPFTHYLYGRYLDCQVLAYAGHWSKLNETDIISTRGTRLTYKGKGQEWIEKKAVPKGTKAKITGVQGLYYIL